MNLLLLLHTKQCYALFVFHGLGDIVECIESVKFDFDKEKLEKIAEIVAIRVFSEEEGEEQHICVEQGIMSSELREFLVNELGEDPNEFCLGVANETLKLQISNVFKFPCLCNPFIVEMFQFLTLQAATFIDPVLSYFVPGKKKMVAREDGINRLPDDILVIILSHLTMKEAATTSVLSRRWRYLWTFYTGSLDFDESALIIKLKLQIVRNPIDVERHRFVRWVNQVLKSHQAQTIYQLKICFDVDSKCDIDGWIDFAIKKKVQSLQLDLTNWTRCSWEVHYAFPLHLLNFSDLSSITALRLKLVNVTGDDLEKLLYYCPNLEVLSVADTTSLLSLKVSGPSLKLKSLELKYCYNLEYLEIFAVNLGSFVYFGDKISIFLKNVPRLTEVSFEGCYIECVLDDLCQHSSYLSQLEKLKLNLTVLDIIDLEIPHSIPPVSGIKHLELTCRDCTVDSLLPCASLLKAFPSLYEFTLKIAITSPSCEEVLKLTEEHSYECLKVVKIIGFGGLTNDTEFVMYLAENSPLLEKLIVDLCSPKFAGGPLEYLSRETARHQLAREGAMQLGAKLPPRIEFVVIYD